ncbi:MAG: DMT family transporter [Acidobacteriota bacterium]
MGIVPEIPSDLIGKIFAFTCAFLWASAVILFKKSEKEFGAFGLNLFKTIIAAIFFFPLLWIFEISLFPEGALLKDYMILIVSGTIGIAIADSLFFKALRLLGAGLTAIVDCLYSPVVLLLSFLFLYEAISFKEVAGGLLVVAAVLIATLKVESEGRSNRDILFGILLGTSAMVAMGISIILMKPVLDKNSVLWVTQVRLVAGSIGLLLYLYFRKDKKHIISTLVNIKNWKFALPGSILGSFIAMILWIAAFKLTSVSSAAILNQTNTIFIVVFASLILKEKFTIRRFAATLLGMGGSIIVMLG